MSQTGLQKLHRLDDTIGQISVVAGTNSDRWCCEEEYTLKFAFQKDHQHFGAENWLRWIQAHWSDSDIFRRIIYWQQLALSWTWLPSNDASCMNFNFSGSNTSCCDQLLLLTVARKMLQRIALTQSSISAMSRTNQEYQKHEHEVIHYHLFY